MTFKPCNFPDGWKGGFATSNPAFAYPHPDLSSLPFFGNMENLHRLDRQIKVIWPEFSWQTVLGVESSRCFSRFAPDISRLGYDDTGRVWSIICPQQGVYSPHLGTLNIEVTVTSNRGWINEPDVTLAADMTVQGQIWFSPSAHEHFLTRALWDLFAENGLPFPSSKETAIKIALLNVDNPLKQVLKVRDGLSPRFTPPESTLHYDDTFTEKHKDGTESVLKAYTVANVEVRIGRPQRTGHAIVDDFNSLVMAAFNLGSGNLLSPGNILTWNVWCTCPQTVCQQEWFDHAHKWRRSIDTGHGSPDGEGTKTPVYRDGSPIDIERAALQTAERDILRFLEKHLPKLL